MTYFIDSAFSFDSLCFSPDNSKLYATSELNVYQYDLSLPATTAITASRTLILVNPYISVYNIICGFCCDTLRTEVGDLKRGTDGKIYMGNNRPTHSTSCLGAGINVSITRTWPGWPVPPK